MVDVASFRVHALAEPEEIVIPDNTGRASSSDSQKPVLVAPAPHTRTTLKNPSSLTTRAIKRAPVKAKRKNVEPRQDGIFKRFTLLVVGYIKKNSSGPEENLPLFQLMLNMISVLLKTMSSMRFRVSMWHALSMKDVPDLTKMTTNRHLTRSDVFQAVWLKQHSLIVNLTTYQRSQLAGVHHTLSSSMSHKLKP